MGGICISLYADSQRTADRMLALRQGSPAIVAIEAFDPAHHAGPTGEVMIGARVDTSLPLYATFRDGRRPTRAIIYPLLAVQPPLSQGPAPVLGFVHFINDVPAVQGAVAAELTAEFQMAGPEGAIVALNGEVHAPSAVRAAVVAGLTQSGRPMVEPLLGIAPYPNGRAVALVAPPPAPWRGVWLVVGLLLLGTGGLLSRLHPYLAERRRLAEIARAGRKRSGVAPVMATHKARSRLAPLAPQPPRAIKPARRPPAQLTALALRVWRRTRGIKSLR